jgi:hypothetical protein
VTEPEHPPEDVRATADEVVEPPAPRALERLPDDGAALAASAPVAPTPHVRRFQVLTGVLIALALVAVTGAIAVAVGGNGSEDAGAATWSPFRPASTGLDTGAQEIAAYVGPQYRLPAGQQIVSVKGGPMVIQGLPMQIAVRHSAADGGKIDLLNGTGVLYSMCGLGPKCSIASGKPSAARLQLLEREALELALYSFHDLKKVDNVVVFMPPAPTGSNPPVALHFRRGDVAGQLTHPLRATLPFPVPTPDTIAQSPDTPFVKALTQGNLFSFSFSQSGQDNSVYLVLDPVTTTS